MYLKSHHFSVKISIPHVMVHELTPEVVQIKFCRVMYIK